MTSTQPELYCLIGDPVSHSLSPFIMNRAFALSGIDATYTTLNVSTGDLSETLRDLREMGVTGVNVTYPYKERIIDCINVPSRRVDILKAANTLHITGQGIHGYNTDATGTATALTRFGNVSLEGKKVVIFGAGGAARAAAYGVLESGADMVTFLVRDPAGAETSIAGLKQKFAGRDIFVLSLKSKKMLPRHEAAVIGSDIIIQATPVGMDMSGGRESTPKKPPGGRPAPDSGGPMSLLKKPDWIGAHHCCFEFVYQPPETAFLKTARDHGATCIDGKKLLISQALEGFKIWTGREFDVHQMSGALDDHLAGRTTV